VRSGQYITDGLVTTRRFWPGISAEIAPWILPDMSSILN
jgi:hypothetical protein